MASTRVTWRYLCYSVTESLKQVFADKTVSLEQVLFWVIAAVNRQIYQFNKEGIYSGHYLRLFTDIPVKVQYNRNNNILKNRKYIELPVLILDMDMDKSVDWLVYQAYENGTNNASCEPVPFQRSTLKEVRYMEWNPHEKPTKDNPYFVRVDKLLYLFGIESLGTVKCDISLLTTVDPNFTSLNLDDPSPISAEDVLAIIEPVTKYASWVLGTPKERDETGADEASGQPKLVRNAQ
jgi:hypothetical protein